MYQSQISTEATNIFHRMLTKNLYFTIHYIATFSNITTFSKQARNEKIETTSHLCILPTTMFQKKVTNVTATAKHTERDMGMTLRR